MAPAIEALSPDEDSEETIVVSKKKLEEFVARLEKEVAPITTETQEAAIRGEDDDNSSMFNGSVIHEAVEELLDI